MVLRSRAASYGYTHVVGYHPLLATRGETRERYFTSVVVRGWLTPSLPTCRPNHRWIVTSSPRFEELLRPQPSFSKAQRVSVSATIHKLRENLHKTALTSEPDNESAERTRSKR
jgi:hypothetical protein